MRNRWVMNFRGKVLVKTFHFHPPVPVYCSEDCKEIQRLGISVLLDFENCEDTLIQLEI